MIKSDPIMPSRNPQQAKWNLRYRNSQDAWVPARVLSDNLHLLPSHGDALELACGLGGNALALARAGLSTQAWDLSDVAIAKLQHLATQQQLPLQACCVDLEKQPLPSECFDVICVSNFLERSLCPAITAALRPGGLLFYQTYTRAKIGKSGPSNPDFLLRQGELLTLFSTLAPLIYREPLNGDASDPELAGQAYLVALKP